MDLLLVSRERSKYVLSQIGGQAFVLSVQAQAKAFLSQ